MTRCERCGSELDRAEASGLCPKCVFAFALTQAEETPPEPSGGQGEDLPGIRILNQIGKGGMGKVYKAIQLGTGRTVAVKVLDDNLAQDPRFVDRFVREARSMGRLNHPNIVVAYDAASHGNKHYLVMEYVDGPTTETLLKKHGRLSEKTCVQIGLQTARALAHAAEHGIVHRDIKPSNLMLTRSGTVKLCDLGLAKPQDASIESGLTTAGTTMGTPTYMSPEQAEGKKVDARSDMYSLGATLFHLATGRPPFMASSVRGMISQHLCAPVPNPRKFNPSLSESFSTVVMKLLSKRPEHRYADHAQLVQEFERIVKGSPVVAARHTKRVTARRVPARRARPSAGLVAAGIAAAVLLALGTVIAVSGSNRPDQPAAHRPKPSRTVQRLPVTQRKPVATPKPKADLEEQIEEFRKLADNYLGSGVQDEISGPYARLEEKIRSAATETEKTRWQAERAAFMKRVNEEIVLPQWKNLAERIQRAVAGSDFREARRLLEEFPDRLRFFDPARRIPTAGEEERAKLAERVDREQRDKVNALAAEVAKHLKSNAFEEAWEVYGKLRRIADASRSRAVAASIVESRLGSLVSRIPTPEELESAGEAGKKIKTRYPTDSVLHELVDRQLKEFERRYAEAADRAADTLARAVNAWMKQAPGLMRERRYRDARIQIARLLAAEDEALAPLRNPELAALAKPMLTAAVPREKVDGWLKQVRSFLPPPSAPPPTIDLLRDLECALVLERLCLAAREGLLRIASDPEMLKKLSDARLSGAKRLEIESGPGDPAGDIALRVRVQPRNAEHVVRFSPAKEGALPDEDLLVLAGLSESLSSREIRLGGTLLAHFSGKAEKASLLAQGLDHPLLKYLGIQAAVAKPEPEPPPAVEGISAKVERKLLGLRVKLAVPEGHGLEKGATGIARFEYGEGRYEVRRVGDGYVEVVLPEERELHQRISAGDAVRLLPGEAPTAGKPEPKGLGAQRKALEKIIDRAFREGSESAIEALLDAMDEQTRQKNRWLRWPMRGFRWIYNGLSEARPAGNRRFEYDVRMSVGNARLRIGIAEDGKLNEFDLQVPDEMWDRLRERWGAGFPGGWRPPGRRHGRGAGHR